MNDQYKIGIILTLIATLVISLIVYVYIQEEANNLNPDQPTPTPTINPTPSPSNTPTPTPDQNEKPIFDVKIIEFKWTSEWAKGPVPGDWRFRHFNATIQNFGNDEVDGLTIEVKIIANNTELQTTTHILYETLDGALNKGESRELIGRVTIGLDILEQTSGDRTAKILVFLTGSVLDDLAIP